MERAKSSVSSSAVAALVLVAWLVAVALARPCRADESIPRPEHPDPQMQREQWLNLNGSFDFWEADDCDEKAALALEKFPDRIVVPFCRESKLSGLARKGFVKNVVYRRDFTVPNDWSVGAQRGRLLLHIGACDWRTVVWVNGQRVGFHEGGSAPITCDVTDALRAGAAAKNELRVWAFDDTRSRLQQCGKQSDRDEGYGCLYTRTTGIWQTVWIERVGPTYLRSVATSLDARTSRLPLELARSSGDDTATLDVVPQFGGELDGMTFVVEVRAGGRRVARDWCLARSRGEPFSITIPNAHRWSPADPFLYDVVYTLRTWDRTKEEGSYVSHPLTLEETQPVVVDEVHSYVGVRDVDVAVQFVCLNGEPLFQRLILDQGFYPDGIWTAPSDDELKHDVERSMAAGFNGARLHQKCFEPRFHYWADKLGYLTWGEAPSWGNEDSDPRTHRVVLQEWSEVLTRDRNHPSIVGWCPFNETGPGSGPLQNAACAITRAIDPTRLLLDTSGYTHSWSSRDVDDAHDYDQNPVSFRSRWWPHRLAASMPARYGGGAARGSHQDRPFFVSEFGGIAWIAPDERNGKNWGYGDAPKSEAEWYARFQGLCDAQLDNPTLFGFCYTQLTDVEQERNGLYYYDRRPKFDLAKLHAIVARPAAIEDPQRRTPAFGPLAGADDSTPRASDWKVVVPSAVDDPQRSWIYVSSDTKLDDKSWRRWELGQPEGSSQPNSASPVKAGRPGFGRKDGFPVVIGTPWTQRELYLFRIFEWDGAPFSAAMLVTHHDEDVVVCLNGEELFSWSGWNDGYEPFDVTARAKALLQKGSNELTVHVSQTGGGQYFDAALLVAPDATKSGEAPVPERKPASGGSK